MLYKRIICLVPSLTELLFDLGLSKQLVGRTRFCIHPNDRVKQVQIIGGTKNPNLDAIRALNPDLIIVNKEENRKEDVEAMRQFCEVELTEISTVTEALYWIKALGNKLGKHNEARSLVSSIQDQIPEPSTFDSISTAYLIWKNPWMSVGYDTYIHDVMELFGLENVFAEKSRYPVTTLEDLINFSPKLVLLSSEPYPFKENHVLELKTQLPHSNIQLIDGEWFSWYGSRMLTSFKKLSHWRSNLSV